MGLEPRSHRQGGALDILEARAREHDDDALLAADRWLCFEVAGEGAGARGLGEEARGRGERALGRQDLGVVHGHGAPAVLFQLGEG